MTAAVSAPVAAAVGSMVVSADSSLGCESVHHSVMILTSCEICQQHHFE